jgi:hypothetical protein
MSEGFATRKEIPWNSMTRGVFGIQTGSGASLGNYNYLLQTKVWFDFLKKCT